MRWMKIVVIVCAVAFVGCGGDDDSGGEKTACEQLLDCCDSLSAGSVGACYQVVEAGQEPACVDTQANYVMAGLCATP